MVFVVCKSNIARDSVTHKPSGEISRNAKRYDTYGQLRFTLIPKVSSSNKFVKISSTKRLEFRDDRDYVLQSVIYPVNQLLLATELN